MTILSELFSSGSVCNGLFFTVQDLAEQIGGVGMAYIIIYAVLIISVVLLFVIARDNIWGVLGAIFTFIIIALGGSAGCLPIPSAFNLIAGVISVFIVLILLVAVNEFRR